MQDPTIRNLEQTRIGAVLIGEKSALHGGPPVTAMLVQNTNPASIAPEQAKVLKGFARDDLFLAVHEQFMTDTAKFADIVLPATMFMEHDDVYRGGGHQYIINGPKLVEGPSLCRSNFFVIEELAKRLGVADKPGFGLDEKQLIDSLLKGGNRGSLDQITNDKWLDCQPSFEESHYLNGFNWPDGKFRLSPDWKNVPDQRPPESLGLQGAVDEMPQFPDHWDNTENANEAHPFRMTTSPARSFLNSTFNNTNSSTDKESYPMVMIHPNDAALLNVVEGDQVRLVNQRGAVILQASIRDCMKPGVVIAEGIWANSAHPDGKGINQLTSAEPIAPHGGAAFHDTHVRVEKV